ncbi:reverse transcriptase/maturase family protein [Opitutales bacterium]|nr:reverse transcriptase/maturase family protein [Opitutales bacterium]
MKRVGHLMPGIVKWENLLLAFCRAERGLSDKYEADVYRENLDENLRFLRDGLADRSFPFGEYHSFEVRDPKTRMIHAPAFRERVAQHAIFNLCEPIMEKKLVDDCFACRKGKGTHEALKRAQVFARRYKWYLKLDVRRYFDSVVHSQLLEMLGRVFKDAHLLKLFAQIIGGYETERGRGLPIGSLASQFFANHYLSQLDRTCKQVLRVPGYLRYMDDFILWGYEREVLMKAREGVEKELDKIGLQLKKRAHPERVRGGVPFLGHTVHPFRMEPDRRARVRFSRKIRSLEWQANEGMIDELELQQRHQCLLGFGSLSNLINLQGSI